jgi:protein-L-isoaspartate(D-aspartate) O-methyltransferase
MSRPRSALFPVLALAASACWHSRPADAEEHKEERAAMVREQIQARGIREARVLAAMLKVKRHLFVPAEAQGSAYDDRPLSIGEGQTISQPYIVAFMTESLRLKPRTRVLEIGTGSGYQAAVLGELAHEVYSIEIVKPLGERAARLLAKLGYRNVKVKVGDGYQGWPDKAPFDAIILTAAPERVPAPLLAQLAVGGVLVAPIGPMHDQRLIRITRSQSGLIREELLGVRFVPMTGKAQQ